MRWNAIIPVIGMAICFVSTGCKAPVHLSYDYGRAYQATFPVQADLTRESVMSLQHPLGGLEGVEIRLKVTQDATDNADPSITLSAN